MILYVENPKDYTHVCTYVHTHTHTVMLELTEFSKVLRYRLNTKIQL
jgi:hypothetical protein